MICLWKVIIELSLNQCAMLHCINRVCHMLHESKPKFFLLQRGRSQNKSKIDAFNGNGHHTVQVCCFCEHQSLVYKLVYGASTLRYGEALKS